DHAGDNWDRSYDGPDLLDHRGAGDHDNVHASSHEFGRQPAHPVESAVRKPDLEHNRLALDVAELSKLRADDVSANALSRRRPEEAHAAPWRLSDRLGLGGKRRSENAETEGAEELSSVHARRIPAHCAGGMVRQETAQCQLG